VKPIRILQAFPNWRQAFPNFPLGICKLFQGFLWRFCWISRAYKAEKDFFKNSIRLQIFSRATGARLRGQGSSKQEA
jgi:hypothetical protein